jgi:hypothetical protein
MTHTNLCQYGHQNCYKHMASAPVVLKLAEKPSPTVDLLDLLEAFPVVMRAVRFDRGLSHRAAASQIGISEDVLRRAENCADNVTSGMLVLILEWLGPMSREEWDELRWADVLPKPLSAKELLEELEIAMAGSNDRAEIARRLGYEKPLSLARRLYRMKKNELAGFFESELPHTSAGPDSISVTPQTRKYLTHEDWEASVKTWGSRGSVSMIKQ